MPYKATQTDGYVHIQWHGMLKAQDLLALAHELPRIGATLGYAPNVLHTFAGMTGTQIEPWSMLQHSLRRRDTPMPNPIRVAWVTDDAEIRRMGELFQELNRNPNIEISVFDAGAAAKIWMQAARKKRAKSRRSATG